ncbi:phage protein Gp36 family protein [Desulfovibrio sp. ZJ200]|uniref:phage protein Gp36 family protein n=1 Tax=Desulfovibrio sp. ZJ200 TaxID=2709792 RepID=UPI0013ED1D1E|nr:phage protein Gp36 family protein [Desulfovibrio sp. ZJ200]
MKLCQASHITDLLLPKYVQACEKLNPGLVERVIEEVSGEVGDALSYRYPQPWPYVPELVRYIAAAIGAYRVIGAITSLMKTEATSENEWIPIQKQWKYATELLEDIVRGRQKLPLEETHPDREDASVAVIAPQKLFDLRGL